MIFRLLIAMLAFSITLSAKDSCSGTPSSAELMQEIHTVLNNGLLLLPQLQPQLVQVVKQIAAEGGLTGATGPTGPIGAPGPTGATGATGATGGGLINCAYIYNLSPQSVGVEEDVIFDSTGLITSGFLHIGPSQNIQILNTGIYQATFSISGSTSNQFALFLNGTLIPGSIYGSGDTTQQNTGVVIFVATAGDILTVRNHTSALGVTLTSPIGGTQANVNASISILQLQ
jgi:hypothetical protein